MRWAEYLTVVSAAVSPPAARLRTLTVNVAAVVGLGSSVFRPRKVGITVVEAPAPGGRPEERKMSIIGFLVFGLVVGAIARLLVPGRDPMGWIGTIVLGLVGSFVCGLLAKALFDSDGVGLIGSVIGAVVVLLIYNAVVTACRHGCERPRCSRRRVCAALTKPGSASTVVGRRYGLRHRAFFTSVKSPMMASMTMITMKASALPIKAMTTASATVPDTALLSP